MISQINLAILLFGIALCFIFAKILAGVLF